MILVFLLYALFASVFTIAKKGVMVSDPLFFLGSRMLIAGIIMLLYQKYIQRKPLAVPKKTMSKLIMLAIFNIYLTNALELCGLQHLTSSKTCIIYSLSPFLSALFCYFMFQETLTPKKWGGLIIGIVSLFPVLFSKSGSELDAASFLYFSWPEMLIIGAVVASVYGWILLKELVTTENMSFITANGFSMLIGGGISLLHSYFVEEWAPFPVAEWPLFIECTLLLVLISNLICYNLYGYLLKKYTPTFLSFAGFTTPFFAAFFGWVYLNETIETTFILSAGGILVGLTLFNQDELKQGVYIPKETIS